MKKHAQNSDEKKKLAKKSAKKSTGKSLAKKPNGRSASNVRKKKTVIDRVGKLIERAGADQLDRAAIATVKKLAMVPKDGLTTGRLQSSFHEAEREASANLYSGSFPVVAVGASAGGIESFTELLSHLPVDTGFAYVFIQHLAPHHESLLPAILARSTQMQVVRGVSGLKVKPNTIYVIPPNTNMGIVFGELKLLPRLESPGRHMPVDFFCRCLADDQNHFAIGIILSGADGDGAQGLRAIRGQGGITLVQDPKTAKVDAMPRSAIAAGGTDTVLSIPQIAGELVRLSKHPYTYQLSQEKTVAPADLSRIFALLKVHTGVDFSKYKIGTVNRRIRRRVLLHRAENLETYTDILRRDPAEVLELYRDMLISVTSFFRDASVFDYLRTELFPKLLGRQQMGAALRVWVPGCATGEEAFSIAICLFEAMEDLEIRVPIQIFASDLSEPSLEKARDGFFPNSITVDVSADRLRKFFTKTPGGYRIAPHVRESCIFAKHDITRDPPFSRMEFISCRNLLIYLEPEHQKKVISLFGYALNPKGYLLLGTSETTANADGFGLVDKKAKVYVRRASASRIRVDLPVALSSMSLSGPKVGVKIDSSNFELEREINRVLIDRYAPVGALVNSGMQILQFRGATRDYLEPAPGEATLSLFKMAKQGLDTELRILMKKAERSGRPQLKENITLISPGKVKKLNLEIVPVKIQDDDPYYLVLFIDQKAAAVEKSSSKVGGQTRASEAAAIRRIREELNATREQLQSIIREQDISNEALQGAHEEVLSSNEELQSTNEELETAKEELQSTNEELSTVNDELTGRNAQLVDVNNDLNNLLASVNIPIVMVGNDLRIRRYTPMAEQVLNIIPTDVGRPITDIKPNIDVPDLETLILKTIESRQTVEREVQDRAGHWHSLRIRPYRTDDDRIDGAVMILVDIGILNAMPDPKREAPAGNLIDLDRIDQPVLILDKQLRIKRANRSFYLAFSARSEETIDVPFFELSGGAWNQPVLKQLMNDIIPKDLQVTDYQVSHEFDRIGLRRFVINAKRILINGNVFVLAMVEPALPK